MIHRIEYTFTIAKEIKLIIMSNQHENIFVPSDDDSMEKLTDEINRNRYERYE